MTKKLNELKAEKYKPTQEEIEQWYAGWEILSNRLDKHYEEIMSEFEVIWEYSPTFSKIR